MYSCFSWFINIVNLYSTGLSTVVCLAYISVPQPNKSKSPPPVLAFAHVSGRCWLTPISVYCVHLSAVYMRRSSLFPPVFRQRPAFPASFSSALARDSGASRPVGTAAALCLGISGSKRSIVAVLRHKHVYLFGFSRTRTEGYAQMLIRKMGDASSARRS